MHLLLAGDGKNLFLLLEGQELGFGFFQFLFHFSRLVSQPRQNPLCCLDAQIHVVFNIGPADCVGDGLGHCRVLFLHADQHQTGVPDLFDVDLRAECGFCHAVKCIHRIDYSMFSCLLRWFAPEDKRYFFQILLNIFYELGQHPGR